MLAGKDAYTHPQPHACQPFRAPVSTPAGPLPIGKIVKDKLIGLEVFDGSCEGNGITRVIAVKENGEKAVLRVVLDGGSVVEATGDHLVYALTSDSTTGRWVRLDSLERGMEMLQSVRDRDAERALANQPAGGQLRRRSSGGSARLRGFGHSPASTCPGATHRTIGHAYCL